MKINDMIKIIKERKNELKKVAVATLGIASTILAVKTSIQASSKIKEAKKIMEEEHRAEEMVLSMEDHPEYDQEAYEKDKLGTDVRFTQSVIKATVAPLLAIVISITCAYNFPKIIKTDMIVNENVVEESVSSESMDKE